MLVPPAARSEVLEDRRHDEFILAAHQDAARRNVDEVAIELPQVFPYLQLVRL
jgi:hypothetical protein